MVSLGTIFPIDPSGAEATEEVTTRNRRDSFSRSIPVSVRVPGEFGHLSAVLLSANSLVHFHPRLFAELVEPISEKAPVVAIVSGPEQVLNGVEALEESNVPRDRVNFLIHSLDSMWIRDFGPIFIRRSDGSSALIDTYYLARDELGSRPLDDQLPVVLANALNLPCFYVPIAFEGGNLIHNGTGLGVSTVKLIQRNQFRNFSGDEFASLMNTYFALKTFTLIPALPGEPTGHADMFMTFTGPRQLVIAEASEDDDEEVKAVLERAVELLSEVEVDGRPIEIHRIPLPPRLNGYWRSYTNVFFVNGLLLVPSFEDVDPAIEKEVLATYQKLLPTWEIKSIPANDLVDVGGFLHCLTLGIPHFVDPSDLLEFSE